MTLGFFDIQIASKEPLPVVVVTLLNHRYAVERELIMRPAAHHIRLVAVDVTKMVPILGNHLDSIRIELIVMFRHQGHRVAAFIQIDVFAVIDARDGKYAQVVEYRSSRAIIALFRQRSVVGVRHNRLVHVVAPALLRLRCSLG